MTTESKDKTGSGHDWPRADSVNVDETQVVALLLKDRRGPQHHMIDVGAHFGGSAVYFHKLEWTVHCFEPDPDNRARLVSRFGSAANVIIDPRAVSDHVEDNVAFFKSEESTGISGLHAFRDTHRPAPAVSLTTVSEIMRERNIAHVDFLKIDAEGFDFDVLKGVSWAVNLPDVVECEFEDYKTRPRGHTYADTARYLAGQGYSIYLSEWHPVVRYGVRHDWRRVTAFPGEPLIDEAWGNILAFRNDPGLPLLNDLFSQALKPKP